MLHCSCNNIWNNIKDLEVLCGVWLKCVDEYCIIYEVTCIVYICCTCLVCYGPTWRSHLSRVRNFLFDYFLLIRSPGRICYFCLNACFSVSFVVKTLAFNHVFVQEFMS